MATYTKETALYDPGKIRDGIGRASNTANTYITEISGTDGISVHDANDELNFVNIDSNGVHIYSDDGNDGAVEVATFGATEAQIGTDDSGHLVTTSNGISIFQDDEQLCEITATDGQTRVSATNDSYGAAYMYLTNVYGGSQIGLTAIRSNDTRADLYLLASDEDSRFWVGVDSLQVSGPVSVQGHAGNIGDTMLDSGTKQILNQEPSYTVVSLSDQILLSPGTYVLVGDAVFPNDAAGVRHLEWRKGSETILGSGITVNATTGGIPTRIQSTTIINLTQQAFLQLGCYLGRANSSSMNVTWYTKVVRIA